MFDIASWGGFLGALAGAAPLVGLVFVSLSINLTRVLGVKDCRRGPPRRLRSSAAFCWSHCSDSSQGSRAGY